MERGIITSSGKLNNLLKNTLLERVGLKGFSLTSVSQPSVCQLERP